MADDYKEANLDRIRNYGRVIAARELAEGRNEEYLNYFGKTGIDEGRQTLGEIVREWGEDNGIVKKIKEGGEERTWKGNPFADPSYEEAFKKINEIFQNTIQQLTYGEIEELIEEKYDGKEGFTRTPPEIPEEWKKKSYSEVVEEIMKKEEGTLDEDLLSDEDKKRLSLAQQALGLLMGDYLLAEALNIAKKVDLGRRARQIEGVFEQLGDNSKE